MSYHERLKQRSPTASELEAQKRRMSQGPTIEELERRLQEAEQATSDTANALGYPSGEVPVMGDFPPAPPANIVISPFYHQFDVTWDEPLWEYHVTRAFIRVKLASNTAQQKTVEAQPFGGYVADLPVAAHTVEASFEDRWGRRSGWSPAVTATPLLTVAESIDFTKAEIAGSLGWDNLDPLTDPANLGNDVVLARAMATQNLAATRLWAGVGAFESAMIGSLAVDKLLAGTFTAGQINIAGGGSMKAGTTVLNADGIRIGSRQVLPGALAVQDAADIGLWVSNAAIGSAKIDSLAVDKLLAGTFTAGQITLAGSGVVRAGQTTLDRGGLTMRALDTNAGSAIDKDYKISALGDWASLSFYNADFSSARGTIIRSDGNGAQSRRGYIALQATSDGTLARLAGLDCYASPTFTYNILYGDSTRVTGKFVVSNPSSNYDADPNSLSGRLLVKESKGAMGIISLTAPDGNQWHLSVNNAGDLRVTNGYP